MGTCRFVLNNLAENATIKNGSGGSPTPPARSEVAPFVMERALRDDRRSLWKTGAPNDVFYFGVGYQADIDLGSAGLVSSISLHGLSCPGGSLSSLEVGYFTSYPSITPNPTGNLNLSSTTPRDLGLRFTEVGARYWYVVIHASAAPVIGRVKIGALLDLGIAPNPGSTSSPFRNRLEQVLEDGSVIVNEVGYPGRDIGLNFDPITPATGAQLETIQRFPGPVTYYDQDDNCFECIVRGGRVELARVGGGLLSAQLNLTVLP